MLYLLQQVDLLEDLALAEFILHVLLLDCLDRHAFACQLVHAEGHFAKGALAYELDKLVELESSRRKLIVLRDVILDVADQLISFLQE